MKWKTAVALLPLSLLVLMSCARSPTAEKGLPQSSQVHDYWVDPTTNLMWAAQDSGKDLSWKGGIKYCQNANLGGYTGWRMPNLDELQSIYDANAESPGLMGLDHYHNVHRATWHVKGNIFLTAYQWTTLRRLDDEGKPTAYVYYFDFNSGEANNDATGWPYSYLGMRVLCVRGSLRCRLLFGLRARW